MKSLFIRILATTTALSLPVAASADEGMWTLDGFPSAQVKAAHGFGPDAAWLAHVRQSAARLVGGCSSSLVSGDGLLLTNHHCVVDCAENLSDQGHDYVKNGFLADDRTLEKSCPGQQAEILTTIGDVTAAVQAAIGSATGEALVKARDAAMAGIKDKGCPDKVHTRCQVVTLYGGGRYALYTYRKYSDVRLVFAPEYQVGQFGGDPDNFNFPRYGFDAAFLRIYEDGKPVKTPVHLRWNPRAPVPGELVFVAGNPGSTSRGMTQAQRDMARDVSLPTTELLLAELRGRLIGAMAGDAEKTRTGETELFSFENSYKALYGQWQSLLDPVFAAKLTAAEATLRARVAADPALAAKIGDPWGEVAQAIAAYRPLYPRYAMLEARAGFTSALYRYARMIVRAAQEREKPDADRLPGYNEADLALVKKQLVDPEPTYPWLEEAKIAFWLSKTREQLTADDPDVKALLGKDSPENLAHTLVTATKLADPAVRQALFDGGLTAVKASEDPLIRYVLAHDAAGRAQLALYKAKVDGPITAAQTRLTQARFAVYGDTLYPDATFTLRLSYGVVSGWDETGRGPIAPLTHIAGFYDRSSPQPPYQLPPRWIAAQSTIDTKAVLDFSTTNDVIGGNSGSPAIAADGSVIGALFDGNIHSLGGNFGYDAKLNRSVVVSTQAVEAELKAVYPAPHLLAELHAG